MEEPEEKEICAHCGRVCGDEVSGYASVRVGTKDGVKRLAFCHITASDRPDCYTMAVRGNHRLENCPSCTPNPALKWLKALREVLDRPEVREDGGPPQWAVKMLELHAPEKEWGYQSNECVVCSRASGSCGCIGGIDDWPCETIQLIADAFGVERWTGK